MVLGGMAFAGIIVVFPIAFIVGLIAVALCLALLGPLARLALAKWGLDGSAGLARALSVATFVSVVPAILFDSVGALVFILPYAIPAAFLYRRELIWAEG